MLNGSQVFSRGISQDLFTQRDIDQQQSSEERSAEPSRTYEIGENEKWNRPRSNILKTLATFWSFLVMGANDSAYGVSVNTKFRESSFTKQNI
jgi:hypothetical protein